MEQTYGTREILAAVMEIYEVPDHKAIATSSRFRNLIKLGLLDHARTGTGTKATYSADDVRKIALAFALMAMGIRPDMILQLVPDLRARSETKLSGISGLA